MSLEALQIYWWVVASVLLGALSCLFFVQGGQMLLPTLGKSEEEKTLIVNSLGRKWELTFTTLVVFGGVMFAAFPLFYSTSFGGAYWVWLAILFCFIIQAVSYEYRKKPNNFLGQKSYEAFLLINGYVGIFLLGVALSTFFSGAEFSLNDYHFVQWSNPLRGLEALSNPANLILGFALVFLSKTLGASYLLNNIDCPTLELRAKKAILLNGLFFLVSFLGFLSWIFSKDAFILNGVKVQMQDFGYFLIFLHHPLFLILLLLGALGVVFGIYLGGIRGSEKSIFVLFIGVFLAVFALFGNLGINGGIFYPSLSNLAQSLSIHNASSSHYTLKAMAYVSILIPIVIFYICVVWRKMDSKKLSTQELEEQNEKY